MIRPALAAVAAFAAGLSTPGPAQEVAPPPVIRISPSPHASEDGSPAETVLNELQVSPARCEGADPVPLHIERPFVELSLRLSPELQVPVAYRFDIDAEGRPVGIAPTGAPLSVYSRSIYGDVAPALAVWRFAAGQPQRDCRITVTAVPVALEDATAAQAARFLMQPGGRFTREQRRILFDRVHPADSDCDERPPVVRLRAYPPFDRLPSPAGAWSYVMTGFDIDARGHPVVVVALSSDSDGAKTEAAVQAVRESRFAPEARHGCTYPYWHRGAQRMAAPARPAKSDFVRPGDRCEAETEWAHTGNLVFPRAYGRRAIEGWALIRFDAAPDGQVSNVEAVESQPTADFGEDGARIVSRSRLKPSDTPRTGCLYFVAYQLPDGPPPQAE